MDFQLKTLSSTQAASEKADALIVLVPSGTLAGKDALAALANAARKAGDLPEKAGKLLSLYRPTGVAAPRVVLVSAGDGLAQQSHGLACVRNDSHPLSVPTGARDMIVQCMSSPPVAEMRRRCSPAPS